MSVGTQYLHVADGSYWALNTLNRMAYFTNTGVEKFSIDQSGSVRIAGNFSSNAQGALAGLGLPNIMAAPPVSTANIAAKTNLINFTPPAAIGLYRLSAMVNVTAWTTPASFTIITTYKDDNGTAQTETFPTFESDGSFSAVIDSIDRFYALPLLLSIDNSATAITLSTTGTFTGSPSYTFAGTLERLI